MEVPTHVAVPVHLEPVLEHDLSEVHEAARRGRLRVVAHVDQVAQPVVEFRVILRIRLKH